MSELDQLIPAAIEALDPYKADFPNEEKFYHRPPIKFLSLIIGALHKHTGFGEGVFSEPEITGGLTTKDDKLNFFAKLKKYTEILLGQAINVDPKQIAAGKEVENTLKFMIAFAQAAKSPKIPFADAAAKLNGGAALAAAAAAPAPDDSAEKAQKAKEEQEEKERLEKEKQEKREKMLKAKAEKERREKERLEKEKQEKEKQEKEKREREERERQERERQEKEHDEEQIEDDSKPSGPAVNARKAPPRIRDARNVVVEAAAPEIIKEGEDEDVDDVFDEEDAHRGAGIVGEEKDAGKESDKGKLLQIITKSRQINEQGKGTAATTDMETFKAGIAIAKDLLQLLARSAQPLDTLIQFSQEDLGNMKNEYKRWTEECERQEKALAKEKAITDQVLGEQMSKIENLDKEIIRQQTKLRSIKASAFLKEADMMKQFTSMCSQ